MVKQLSLAGVTIGLLAACCSAAAPKKPSEYAIRVNCGAAETYTDTKGNVWQPDQMMMAGRAWGYEDGETVERNNLNISGVCAPAIYSTERFNMSAYAFEAPNGKYTVRLHFAETYGDIRGEGERVFNVTVNKKIVLKDFDPYRAAGGWGKPVCKQWQDVEVTDGRLTLGFEPNVQNPEINGIEILGQ